MNITEIANRISEKHYPNLPTAPCDNAYRDGRMNELVKLVESELKNLRLAGDSGQRELLISFLIDIEECYGMEEKEKAEKFVDDYLSKENNKL